MALHRRTFMLCAATAGATTFIAGPARAQAMVDEKDPTAAGLGYVADAKKADAKKYSKYAPGQMCSNCTLFQGAAGAKAGGCPLFVGKQVAATGWCSAYAKKG
jgi:hypothetical protein